MQVKRLRIWLIRSLIGLTVSATILYGYPSATLTYGAVDLFHMVAGLLFTAGLLRFAIVSLFRERVLARVGWILLFAGGLLGVLLLKIGTPMRLRNWLYAHMALCALGGLIVLGDWLGSRDWFGISLLRPGLGWLALLGLAAGISAGAWWTREKLWAARNEIKNPAMPPETMEDEGDGVQGKFFPSSAQTTDGKNIPAEFFMKSDACQRCHGDVYKQWDSSMHHFSSFNNQWYRKSIEYLQDVSGVKPSKWCAGCHDPALLFSGEFDQPIREIENRPEARAGLGCMMCHSIVQVKSTMGQGDFILEYPKLHALAASENPLVRRLHDFMVRVNPEPHRRTFLKPFMRTQTAEFCSTCHKVHLDVPVNRYRWIRGFNEYDNWQASGVSGQGARSFYYPKSPMTCPDCHMPLVRSTDEATIGGFVHSHAFPGANTAVPVVNQDHSQFELSKKFLQDNEISVDIFAVSAAGERAPQPPGARRGQPELSTSFAVGEESDFSGPGGAGGEARAVTAPLGRVSAVVRRGDNVLVDTVVRTKKVGHFFPGGTIDAYDVWLELKATDERGQTLFWSGKAEDDGKGPVEPGAHFYRALLIDAHGNPINKRNASANRATVYVHLIPPGAADTAHFRVHIPDNAGERITLHAKLNYRKFMWWNTHFAYAGIPESSSEKGFRFDYDDRNWNFTGDTSGVSGNLKAIPDLPIITLAEDEKTLLVNPRSAAVQEPTVVLAKEDWMRWNDYGIGLFLQGDLKGARAAFERATQSDPGNPDGWVNIARTLAQEGETEGAATALDKALAIAPALARAHFFYARVLREIGKYDQAAEHLRIVLKQYPRDRVVINELGRVFFLEKRYAEAVEKFESTLAIDPEDLQAHYNLMLCYNGLGDPARAEAHKTRYLRFKADESAQAITGPYRQGHPEDNNERQPIHEHGSVALDSQGPKHPARVKGAETSAATANGRTGGR